MTKFPRTGLGNYEFEYNRAPPLTMHIDLNSCFATVEQQARPKLRGKPVVVNNRHSPNAAIVTASYEAKRLGIKMGMRMNEARALVPQLISVETDPPKYHFVYQKLLRILQSYSPSVVMKSIDEGIIDFSDTRGNINTGSLTDIGREIKARLKSEIGNYITCNVGIGPNRFLAKTAAGLHKPDGLDEINYKNLRATFTDLKLTDLTGIAHRNQARLNAVGIMTSLQFLDASQDTLSRLVFKGKPGRDWYRRLRGYEVDAEPTKMGIVGRQFVLDGFGLSRDDILRRLHFLSFSTGAKLRLKNKQARGVYVYARTRDYGKWSAHHLFEQPLDRSDIIYETVRQLFTQAPAASFIKEIGVSCYHLSDSNVTQPSLLEAPKFTSRNITRLLDNLNARYGASTIQPASVVGLEKLMKQKIPFGSTRYFEMLGVTDV
jgi:DNA polymerase-4